MNCMKCGHKWMPKVPRPVKCPLCGTVAYMYPPGMGLAGARRVHVSEVGEMNAEDMRGLEAGLDPGRGPIADFFSVPRLVPESAEEVSAYEREHPGIGRYGGEVPAMPRALDSDTYRLPPMEPVSMDDLRKIASGEVMVAPLPDVVAADSPQRCQYAEFDPDTGETVHCSLPVHGPKVRHVPGRPGGKS